MTQVLWIAEKKSLVVEAILPSLSGKNDEENRMYIRRGNNHFIWLDGHAFEQAMPDHYLPDDIPKTKTGGKRWRMSDLPIVPEVNAWKIFPKASKKERLVKLKELLKTCDEIVNLGDPDAEGQLLVDEALIYYNNKKPVKRVLINDYNPTKVKESLANVKSNNDPVFQGWYRWGLARSRYDWLFGLNGTRAMTLRGAELGYRGVLPVGSVQTPLLYIIRERDRIIENFKPIPYFTITGNIKHENGLFLANWKAKENQAGLDDADRLIDESIANILVTKMTAKDGTISAYSKVKKEKKPPLPLSMNELSMDGFAKYGYSAQQVLDAAQKLYDTYKVTTYPRSDNRYLSEAQHNEAGAVMTAVMRVRPDLTELLPKLDSSRKSAAFDDKKMEGNPHHGIVPTIPESDVNISSWSEIERRVYDLIVRSYLSQFAENYVYESTKVEILVNDETLVTTGNVPLVQGWKEIYAEVEDDTKAKDEDSQNLPSMRLGDSILCSKCVLNSCKTSPPPRFDDRLLTDAMMNIHRYVIDPTQKKRLKDGDGIGTTATRAGIVQDMKNRELIIPVKAGSKKIMTSTSARSLVDAITPEVKDPAQAAIFKSQLDLVASGELPFDEFILSTVTFVHTMVADAKIANMTLPVTTNNNSAQITGGECQQCKTGTLVQRKGKHGVFWSCTNWNAEPKCTNVLPDLNGKPQLETITCPQCKTGNVKRKIGQYGAFWYCSNWNSEATKCDARFDDQDGKLGDQKKVAFTNSEFLCKVDGCGKPLIKRQGIAKTSKKPYSFFGCSGYPTCKQSYDDVDNKPAYK